MQVLITLVQLDVSKHLLAGPKSALQLAPELGPGVHPDWLERVLAAAYAYGMVGRVKAAGHAVKTIRPQPAPAGAKSASSSSSGSDAGSQQNDACCAVDQEHHNGLPTPTKKGAAHTLPAAAPITGAASTSPWLYKLNAMSSTLCDDHPACMANFVRLLRHHYQPFGFLAQGVASSRTPFELCHGSTYWDYNLTHPQQADIFDKAMAEVNELGGLSVLYAYPWAQFAGVVDVAGGTGGFVASMLQHNPQLRTWVLDRAEQVAAGTKVSNRLGVREAHAQWLQALKECSSQPLYCQARPSGSTGKVPATIVLPLPPINFC
jgi:hypothetical protein